MALLSNLIVGNQKFLLFKDHLSKEKDSQETIISLLKSQNESNIAIVPERKLGLTLQKQPLQDIELPSEKCTVILPPASKLFQQHFASDVFKTIQKLRNSSNVKQIFLWLTVANFPEHDHIPDFVEHMADTVVRLQSQSELELLIRKATGSVTRKQYQYELTDNFLVNEIKKITKAPVPETPQIKPESLGTFKIELSEKDKIARSNLVLPFEKHLKIGDPSTNSSQQSSSGGKVIYDLDKDDDFDEEDPDDDLDI